MFKQTKIIPHEHTGKLRPHQFTSYLPLLILLIVTAVPLSFFTAFAQSPGPESRSISLTGVVPGQPPTAGAVITQPTPGQRFSQGPITVSGTCPAGTLVEVYKNDIFAGSTICSSNGIFAVDIDLLFGENTLTARVYDALNQAGPPSNSVTVIYDLLPPQGGTLSPISFGGAQLLLNTDSVFRGAFPGDELLMPLTPIGGTPPFAINIQWGDGNNRVVSRNSNEVFTTAHVFTKPGTYQVSIQATDAEGRVAFLTVAAIVNGAPNSAGAGSMSSSDTMANGLLALWPLYVSLVAIVLSFWLGEIREKHVLAKHATGNIIPLRNP